MKLQVDQDSPANIRRCYSKYSAELELGVAWAGKGSNLGSQSYISYCGKVSDDEAGTFRILPLRSGKNNTIQLRLFITSMWGCCYQSPTLWKRRFGERERFILTKSRFLTRDFLKNNGESLWKERTDQTIILALGKRVVCLNENASKIGLSKKPLTKKQQLGFSKDIFYNKKALHLLNTSITRNCMIHSWHSNLFECMGPLITQEFTEPRRIFERDKKHYRPDFWEKKYL